MKLINTITLLSLLLLFTVPSIAQNQQKTVIAECNPFYNYSLNKTYLKGVDYERIIEGNDNFKNGKLRMCIPLVSQLWVPLTLDDALAHEIRMAKKMGINTFRFPFFISNTNSYTDSFIEVVHKYLEVAEKRNIDFKFSIEIIIRRPAKLNHSAFLEQAKHKLRKIYDNKIGNTRWLKDQNGDIMVFVKSPEHIHHDFNANSKIKTGKEVTPKLMEIKNYYKYLFEDVYGTFSLVYFNNFVKDMEFAKNVLQHFSSMYYPPFKQFRVNEMNRIANICKKNKAPFIQPVYANYLDSRLKKKSDKKYIGKNSRNNYVPKDLFVNSLPTNFTQDFRKTLDFAVQRDAQIIDITSWNNFDHGTHISPELHTEFAFGEILRYKLKEWKKESDDLHEQCIVSQFKPLDTNGITVNENVNPFNKKGVNRSKIEIITLLNKKASLYVGSQYIKEVEAGLDYVLVDKDSIKGKINIVRDHSKIIEYSIPNLPVDQYPDALYYSSTSLKSHLWNYYSYDMIYEEIYKNRARYLLSNQQLKLWSEAAVSYALAKQKLLETYHFNYSKYEKLKVKEEKKYYASIKKILSPLHYKIFIEMEDDIKNGTLLAEEISFDEELGFDNYNLLQPE
ncbi:hypothetical protein [Flammeovirga sp. SJP92]|uniref:hypothetical protein n=1 Tax=Flammeovirga sp. SJP92 TaxID=1775430 RepID=UPI000788CF1E|nr:hypothetical protein [Flammeovirga sp. SJP92]KXX67177.1 hypothetical protein AVL50_27705 [Flammeovirga sp. SJP92]